MCEKNDSLIRKSLTEQEKKIKRISANGSSKASDVGMEDINERIS